VKKLNFTLEDLSSLGKAKLDGSAVLENGQLLIRLNTHGNCSEVVGPIIAIQLDMGDARLIVFRNINSDEPTDSLDLDGALEVRRKP
jgi:uncharacterized protein YaiL (DUF2058 family)